MGTSPFSVFILEALTSSRFEISAVVTQPDRPGGRGREVLPPPLKKRAEELGLPVFQPERVNRPEFLEMLQTLFPEVIVVAAFGQILRSTLLHLPSRGCVNVHASLLPGYRGADPIRWSILNGERETGVSIMVMDEGVDTGPILTSQVVPIEETDQYRSLERKLGLAGGELLVHTLPLWLNGTIQPVPQEETGTSLAGKISKEMLRIDWNQPASFIARQVRAFAPCPGAYFFFRERRMKVLQAWYREDDCGRAPGTVVGVDREEGILVGTGKGVLVIEQIQPENKKILRFREWCCGYRIQEGEKFQ